MDNTNSQLSKSTLLTWWMDDILEDRRPKNVYTFCKNHAIEETSFYKFYNSLSHLEQGVWVVFYENSIELLHQNESFNQYDDQHKLISFYFTFFEALTLNRSYVIEVLPKDFTEFQKLKQLEELRKSYKGFIAEQIDLKQPSGLLEQLTKYTGNIAQEGYWIQLLFILHFWVHDTSESFEKTDILIEKIVTTSADLIPTKPLENLLDLGKFLFKEKFSKFK
jgi:hypothetical protein